MAKLSFGIQGQTMDFTVERTIQDADAPRILAYLASTEYGRVAENGVERDASPQEAADAFAGGILRGLMDQTVRFEKEEAARAAAEAVTPIEPVS
jgi:hypothetical protein